MKKECKVLVYHNRQSGMGTVVSNVSNATVEELFSVEEDLNFYLNRGWYVASISGNGIYLTVVIERNI